MSEFPDLRQPSAFDPTIKVGQTTPNLPTDPQPVRETAPVPEVPQDLSVEYIHILLAPPTDKVKLTCGEVHRLIHRIAQEKARVRELEHRCKVFVKGLENEEEDCGALHDQIEALEQRAAKAEANFNALNTKFSRLLDRLNLLREGD